MEVAGGVEVVLRGRLEGTIVRLGGREDWVVVVMVMVVVVVIVGGGRWRVIARGAAARIQQL